MNVKTGAILAMASLEQFDPNDPMTDLRRQDARPSWTRQTL